MLDKYPNDEEESSQIETDIILAEIGFNVLYHSNFENSGKDICFFSN